ncbi:hypothetical protein [Pseudonocardia humida]|uniref:DUF4367 domain-containing protein n=1 Tax=Pseudonocardia humida TaxID=2800819 RepID=A0ABT0ZY49_9PSEU|nr:hypothetical protein [Pseudonocardia humida]MCO1655595.1 hypothetical protein [Pseudonocardia humida]
MRHPTDGTLRRLVDEPAGVADTDREHVADCPVCLSELVTAQREAAAAAAALDVEVAVDVEAGWRRLSRSLAADDAPGVGAPTRRRWRSLLRSPAIAAVGVVALLTGAGAAAAADWLQIFRPERVAPITVTRDDLLALPELTAYGRVDREGNTDVRDVADAAAAERATGIAVPRVGELPRGVTGEPTYQVRDRVTTFFTFSAAEAAAAAAEAGGTLPPPPPGLDGSRFRLTNGPRVAAVWSSTGGVPALVVARTAAPTVDSSGTPFETARDYVLTLPGLPADLAEQLRSVSADGTTLPLRVLSERMTSSSADVNGTPATVLTSRDATMAAVVWLDGGLVTAVAGSLSADEVLAVARGLR